MVNWTESEGQMAYVIKPLLLSTVQVNEGSLTYMSLYDREITSPIVAWYVLAGDKHVLIDTGMSQADMVKYTGLAAQEVQSFDQALASVGVTAEDIDILVVTHLHHDHVIYAHRCSKAKVVVQEDEFKFAYSDDPLFGGPYIHQLFDGLDFSLVSGDCEILPGIRVLLVGGHSPGCQAVCVDTSAGKAIISGMCATLDNFYPPSEIAEYWPVIIPTLHVDGKKCFSEMQRLKSLADILIPCHEIKFAVMKQIPKEGS
jgi:glyoxylase-like metal-dependent hydrolase (beta-lactamase superfamily II)